MNGLFQQLGGLVLGSVPTIILFLITLVAYRVLVHGPLTKTLKERYARTQGAVANAQTAIAVAERKTAEYEERLRVARAGIFHVRHERLNAIRIESEQAIAQTRVTADEHIAAARIRIEGSVEKARLDLDPAIDELAARVLHAVLPAGSAPEGERA